MCMACETVKQGAADTDALGNEFLDMINKASAALMVSVGHRTGLFAALAAHGPATSEGLARAAGLHERYVREWLGAMTAAGFVQCDGSGTTFSLAEGWAPLLVAGNGSPTVGHLAQFIGMMGSVEDRIVDCFHQGGGVPYSAYPRFQDVMVEESRQTVVDPLLDHILPLVPGLTLALKNGIRAMDVGCGRGAALHLLAKTFPNSRFVGYDLSEEAIRLATARAQKDGLANLRFEARDLTTFDQDAEAQAFDLALAFDAIHDQARPDRVLAGIRRSLGPDGLFLMQDIGASSNIAENRDHPLGALLYTISCMHCMTVSLAQGGLGLGAAWGEQQTLQFLSDAGFRRLERHTLPHDIQNYYYIARP